MNDTNHTVAMPEEDGAQLLDEVYRTLSRYVCFASEVQAYAVTQWVVATHPSVRGTTPPAW